tara:strand:+ start:36255 stop:36962 length:708 start_codon:yes stop_codon:yes gene_type:complete
MSSRFVSGGTVDQPTERDDEWRKAQAELEAARKAKADLAAQHDGKSLFEILQENKDKKQAEFEERAKYKLHVSLNDDEADYLDAVEEKKRKEEASVRKDTQEQLDAFRRQQEEAERKALEEGDTDAPKEGDVQWVAPGRKRKKGPEMGLLKGVKLRKSSSITKEPKHQTKAVQETRHNPIHSAKSSTAGAAAKDIITSSTSPAIVPSKSTSSTLPVKPAMSLSLGLGYASSDDED